MNRIHNWHVDIQGKPMAILWPTTIWPKISQYRHAGVLSPARRPHSCEYPSLLDLTAPCLYGTGHILKKHTNIENKAGLFAKNLLKSLKTRLHVCALCVEHSVIRGVNLCSAQVHSISHRPLSCWPQTLLLRWKSMLAWTLHCSSFQIQEYRSHWQAMVET